MEKYCTPRFVFNKVITFPVYVGQLIVACFIVPSMWLYYLNGFIYLGKLGWVISFLVGFGIARYVINRFAKTVIIYFDKQSMYISQMGKAFRKISLRDVAGLYSYDYERLDKSAVSLQFVLKSGEKIRLADHYNNISKDPEKAEMLRQFLRTAQRRLQLTYQGKNRWRTLCGLGACWYASTPAVGNSS